MLDTHIIKETADTLEKLQVLGLPYHHDHAWFLYFGVARGLPSKYKKYKTTKKYILLVEEEIPLNENNC